MMDPSDDIFQATWECRKLFERCQSTPFSSPDPREAWLEQQEVDFKLWANGIQADRTGHSSLDYRLRKRPDIIKVVLDLINNISTELDNFLRGDKGYHLEASASYEEQPSYIETSIGFLRSMSIAIKRSGNKFRHERADLALEYAPTDYKELKDHLTTLILMQPYVVDTCMSLMGERSNQVVAVVVRAWARDPSRLTRLQRTMIDGVMLRHNRIRYAQDPWLYPRDFDLQRSIGNVAVRSQTSPELSTQVVVPRHQTILSTSVGARRVHKPEEQAQPESGSQQSSSRLPRRVADLQSISPLRSIIRRHDSSVTATDVGSRLILPDVWSAVEAMDTTTEISDVGYLDEYPPRPEIQPGSKVFHCPYCCQDLPGEYLDTKSKWW